MQNKIILKKINILNDAMFKCVMCSPKNREMVVDVLYAFTKIDKNDLRNATYIGGEEILKKNMKEKMQRTDLTVRINKNCQIIVEMNQSPSKNIFEKNTDYAFSRIVENTFSNALLYPKIVLINIDNFNKFKTDKPILEFKLRDHDGHIETEMYKSIHLILANAKKSSYNIDEELKKFARFLRQDVTIQELENEFKGEEKYMAALRTVEDLSTDPRFQGYYDVEEAHRQEIEDMKQYALEQGLEQGIEKGIAKGIKEGIEQGIEQGKEQNTIEIAKNLLKLGVNTLEQIAEVTKLSLEEINHLKKEV